MFGSSKKKPETGKSTMPASTSLALNSLVQGTEIVGKIKAKTDFRVDGFVKGDLQCDSKVIIGPTGMVEGSIDCRNAVIEGKFNGTLKVIELLNIRETANVIGEVTYGKLIVQSGAVISGTYKVQSEADVRKHNGIVNQPAIEQTAKTTDGRDKKS
jgi:cytoskeletal protein CcmA (bactofilin family)